MTMKPLHDRVLIKVTEDTNQTASGIILPDSSKDKPTLYTKRYIYMCKINQKELCKNGLRVYLEKHTALI